MNSNDIIVEVFRSEIGELKTEIRSGFEHNKNEFKEVRAEIQTVKDIAIANSAKIDAYRDFTSIWFTIIAIIVALVGIMVTLAPMFREMYKDAKKSNLRDEIRSILHDEVDTIISSTLNIRNK